MPDFLSANDLLAKTVTVLTGARGCGKTMSFRRMTKLMDALLEEGSGVRGADQFIGFYLNCRDLLDAFPWVPRTLPPSGEQQVIHFFHLAWIAEICKTLARVDLDEAGNYKWLQDLLLKHYAERFVPVVSGGRVLAHIRSFVEADKETCRKVPLGKTEGLASWPLARLDFLDELQQGMSEHIGWAANKPLYLFLDDYTIPLVPPKLQQALNPIIFKRRSEIFFKVSTEAANSFLAVGPNKKPLEIHHDFHLLDLASESLHQGAVEKEAMLDRIFKPRIKRYSAFSACAYGLADVLGKTPYDYNELAWQMRGKDDKKKIYYFGKKVFVGLWTSDIRIMVEMFSDMLREGNGKLAAQNCEIAREVQDRCIRAQGGEMMTFTQSVRDPELSKRSGGNNVPGESFGLHLKSIVEAFINVSKHELMKGALVKNEGHTNPKQAFRLEVVDSFEPTTKGRAFLAGLVRYHIFLQDWRGKSQRGMLTPRLYLNRIFLPHAGLTLSSHDNIRVKNQELTLLLETPHEFYEYWRKKKGSNDAQTSFCV